MRRPRALLLALLLLLTGCAALAEPDVAPEEEWDGYGMIEEEPEEPEPAPEPAYPAAFSLVYQKDQTLDPVNCGEGIQEDVASLLYEPLFRLDGQFNPVPVLCESYAWDETGLVCTLTLRQDAAFQDGTPLTAADAAASIQRAAASARYGYRLRGVASAAANRAGQVVVTLYAPNQGLPALLDIPIVKRGTENLPAPTGTGPYVLVTGGEGDYLLANEEWWQHKALPVTTIPLVHAKDRDNALYLFSSHRAELLTVDPMDNPSSATGQSQRTDRPTAILQFIGFNTAADRLFASPALRAIFSQGIPRETLVDAQLAKLALAAQFPVSPLSALYPADLERDCTGEETLEALRAAGQGTGEVKELSLLVNQEDSFRVTSAQFIAESLSVLDWRITVRALPWEEYTAALAAGDFDLYFGEVRLTADWDLRDLVGTGGALNYGGYTNASTDLILAGFAAAADRQAAARQLMAHLQAAAPIAPICFKNYAVLTHAGVVEGLSPSPSTTFYGMEEWTVHLSQ